jgi:very-short-patch-repair endonuclease
MTCLECNKELGYLDHKNAMDSLGVELCDKHHARMQALIKKYDTPLEAIQLYYGLKEAGVKAMLEWWDGKKSVDIAISRVKLNIEIDSAYERLTEDQAINNLEEAMHSFKNGFTTIRIPHIVVRYYLNETVRNIIGIMEGLKANIKIIN